MIEVIKADAKGTATIRAFVDFKRQLRGRKDLIAVRLPSKWFDTFARHGLLSETAMGFGKPDTSRWWARFQVYREDDPVGIARRLPLFQPDPQAAIR